ncbi:unnamed protein product [Rotaria sp. Silwood2]|nr:unnamed protein product [Rotaria sp. Silwood2]
MYGDILVILSDEPINPAKSQPYIRCLICYIAERPSLITTNYYESYSYLNTGEPYLHGVIKMNGQHSRSSCSFHRGCSIENYLSYCLKIEKTAGQAALSHAGPNNIYRHETITCQFSKTTLDLSKLKYVHVSGGSQKVTIRNLIISCDQIFDLYPSFDRDLERGGKAFPRKKRSHSRDRSPSIKIPQLPRDKSPSMINKAVRSIRTFFGYDSDGKNIEASPCSINCLLQNSTKHIKEYCHPCPYSELCSNKEKESYLPHEARKVERCSSKNRCQKLEDPVHQAKYRHSSYPDFLIPCPNGQSRHNKTLDHRTKYLHGQQVELTCDDMNETSNKSSSKSRSGHQEKEHDRERRSDQRTMCRHGSECHDQNNAQHCSKYSHTHDHGPKHLACSSHERIACRHDESESSSSPSRKHERIVCRHGRDYRDKNDSHHCAKYSHQGDERDRGHRNYDHNRIPCKFGEKCHDTDPHHRSKYSHPNKK